MATKKTILPRLMSDDISDLINAKNKLNGIKSTMTRDVIFLWNKEWENRGGCKKCQGREKIILFDKIGGERLVYCSECTENSREAGLNFSFYDSKSDPRIGVSDPRERILGNIFYGIDDSIIKITSSLRELEYQNTNFVNGNIVCVTKGRKVPIGFVGKIFCINNKISQYNCYNNIGIVNQSGVTEWTNINNLQKLSDQNLF